jgi:hypothetical protein
LRKETPVAKTEYEKIFGSGRGRRPLSSEEKAQRKIESARRNIARNRALAVLQHRYPDEYEALYSGEYSGLEGNPKYDVKFIKS